MFSMSSSLHDDLAPVALPRAHTENLDATLESDADKVAHHKVGRFDVGIKKEVSRLDSSAGVCRSFVDVGHSP